MLPVLRTRKFGFPVVSRLGFDPFTEIDRVAGSFLGDSDQMPVRVDVYENDESYIIEADVPGLSRDDIDITVENGVLTIAGARHVEESKDGENYFVTERRMGKFSRAFRLDSRICEDGVNAQLKDGVLTVTVAKPEEVKPRRIEVKAN
jgi:HSP20 family protein